MAIQKMNTTVTIFMVLGFCASALQAMQDVSGFPNAPPEMATNQMSASIGSVLQTITGEFGKMDPVSAVKIMESFNPLVGMASQTDTSLIYWKAQAQYFKCKYDQSQMTASDLSAASSCDVLIPTGLQTQFTTIAGKGGLAPSYSGVISSVTSAASPTNIFHFLVW
eukprot:CAMPEP_0113943564 /NCGR_PEP_ID=MMETSP1339-20121228/26099_1 /TAXON_ID=94617 /ORGANISM="Fibrocapsa japonica" /LENGTH=165 /DNA_ID=CAMNT_0000948467 /DNA_START=64 /DNA_END=558 /DNA_ORIENTATION=+ /assembly_acc=CAM_ASM_000762